MNKERVMQILQGPLVSEKSTNIADTANQFVFRVSYDASKPEIRKAVELMFNVKVDQVRVINIKGKRKRFGAIMGMRNGIRKAYVKLQPGYDINFGMGA